jgi:hypothetical protein
MPRGDSVAIKLAASAFMRCMTLLESSFISHKGALERPFIDGLWLSQWTRNIILPSTSMLPTGETTTMAPPDAVDEARKAGTFRA